MFLAAGRKMPWRYSCSRHNQIRNRPAAVRELKAMGLEVMMITGDSIQTARHIAGQAGIAA
jgi:P-type E1-E2 ATPase